MTLLLIEMPGKKNDKNERLYTISHEEIVIIITKTGFFRRYNGLKKYRQLKFYVIYVLKAVKLIKNFRSAKQS